MTKSNNALDPNDIVRGTITIKKDGWTGEGFVNSTPRYETQEYADFNEENRIDHGFWLNDLYFEVPPERISVQEENNFMESQAMRSRGSAKIPVGIANEIYTIQFNIVEKDSIKNIDERGFMPGWNTGKRGGVLDLILQFKNVPFVCVENAFLRSRLKIPDTHNMVFCAHNLALSTSPGEPGVLVGSLTLSPMGYTPFSDRWLFKKTWGSVTGKSSFEDVNFHELAKLDKRVWYQWQEKSEEQKKIDQAAIAYSANTFFIASKVIAPDAAGTGNRQNVVNPRLTNNDDRPLNRNEADLIEPFAVTRYASESDVYKTYIDWLHAKHMSVKVNNSYTNNTYDFTKISPYGSRVHDTGRELKFTWREFKTIPIDPEVSDAIRLYIKRKLTLFRWDLFKGNQVASTFYSGDVVEGYTLGEWEESTDTTAEVIPYIIVDDESTAVQPENNTTETSSGSGAGSGSGGTSEPGTTGATENPVPDSDGSAVTNEGSAQIEILRTSTYGIASNGVVDFSNNPKFKSEGVESNASKVNAQRQNELPAYANGESELLALGYSNDPSQSGVVTADIAKEDIQNALVKRTQQQKEQSARKIKEDLRRQELIEKRRSAAIRGLGNA